MTDLIASLTRRRLISTAAMGGLGLASAGIPLHAFAQATYDMIIIGAGTAGIPAAIFAAEQGAKVLMIEKSDQVGGTLWLTGGSMSAAGTRVQAQQGIKDSPDLHYEDIMRIGFNRSNPEVLRRFVDNAAGMANWLDDIGFRVRAGDPVAGRAYSHAAYSVRRYFQGPERGRSLVKVLMPLLRKHVDAGAVQISMSTTPAELVIGRDRSVQGVIATGPDGVRRQISGRKVVITTGGYMHSPEAVKRVTGLEGYMRPSSYTSKGEGLLLGEAAGGFVRNGENQVFDPTVLNDRNYPTVRSSVGLMTDPNRRQPWEIRVNKLGQRFWREDEGSGDLFSSKFTKQPAQKAWIVYDQAIADDAPPILPGKSAEEVASLFANHPMFFKEASLDALAARTGVDAGGLKRTIEEYNEAVQAKRDRLGREFLPRPIGRGPFYAVELSGSNIISFGGLAINRDLRIIRPDGSPIRGLYAAGEVIGFGHIAGNAAVGGTGVTPALTFGRLIGLDAMKPA